MATATAKQKTESVQDLGKRLATRGKVDLASRVSQLSRSLQERYEERYGHEFGDVSPCDMRDEQQRRDWLACRRALAAFSLVYRLERGEAAPDYGELHGFILEATWSVPQETAAALGDCEGAQRC